MMQFFYGHKRLSITTQENQHGGRQKAHRHTDRTSLHKNYTYANTLWELTSAIYIIEWQNYSRVFMYSTAINWLLFLCLL